MSSLKGWSRVSNGQGNCSRSTFRGVPTIETNFRTKSKNTEKSGILGLLLGVATALSSAAMIMTPCRALAREQPTQCAQILQRSRLFFLRVHQRTERRWISRPRQVADRAGRGVRLTVGLERVSSLRARSSFTFETGSAVPSSWANTLTRYSSTSHRKVCRGPAIGAFRCYPFLDFGLRTLSAG